MAMDGLCLYASMLEIRALTNGKIDKITQPEKDELLLTIRTEGKNSKVLFSASPVRCGVYLTEQKRANPLEAPMFCMLLRKRLIGGRIAWVDQPRMDRILRVGIRARNELGDETDYTLVAEIMGKYSNLILVDAEEKIVDAIKHVGMSMSSVRMVMPGLLYELPPQQDKTDPREETPEGFYNTLCGAGKANKLLSAAYFGLSPATADGMLACVTEERDAALLTETDKRAAAEWLCAFYAKLSHGEYTPALLCNDFGEAIAVYPFAPHGDFVEARSTMGEAMDAYYAQHERQEHMQRRGTSLRKILQNNVERCEKKLSVYASALQAGDAMELDRRYGELLTANLHLLRANAAEAVVEDYYAQPPAPLIIPMDKLLTPGQNAQRYYKKYQKAKIAMDMAAKLRVEALEELAYLEGQLDNLDKCTGEVELAEIREELREQGYVRRERGRAKPQKLPASKPWHYVSSDGCDIYIGKNNKQNDALTLRLAAGEDIWLHVKDIPGSHVILKQPATDRSLQEAAMLAAYYSKARGGENVAVDYTPRKYVKKPNGAKPGMVIYTTNRTAYVTPDEALIKRLAHKE